MKKLLAFLLLLSSTLATAQRVGQLPSAPLPLSGTELISLSIGGAGSYKATTQAIANLASGPTIATWTPTWVFTKDYTYYYKQISAPLTIAPASGSVFGGAVYAEMVADGANAPTFDTAFTTVSGSWVNTAGQVNIVLGFRNTTGYTLSILQGKVITVPDITPPVLSTATATTAHNIRVVFNEPVTSTTAGWSFSNGSALTIAGVSGTGTNTLNFNITQTLTPSDVITRSYNSGTGNCKDLSNNVLASFTTQAVTNSVPGAFIYLTIPTTSGTITESPTHTFSGNTAHGVAGETMAADGSIEAEVVTTNSWSIGLDAASNLETIANFNYFVFPLSGTMYADELGGAGVNTGITATVGLRVKIERISGDVKAMYWNGSAWALLYDFPTNTSVTLYPKVDFYGGGTGTFTNFEGIGCL